MEPVSRDYIVTGEKVYLRPILEEDTDMVLSWRNADFVVDNFFYRLPISKEEHLNWVRNKVNKGLVYQFIVYLKETDEAVGCVYLQHFDVSTNSMESGVFMSEKIPKGQGIGTEAVSLLNYEFAFKKLNLTKTIARVLSRNVASVKLHEKVGFVEKSRENESIIPSGEFEEAITFELINKNW